MDDKTNFEVQENEHNEEEDFFPKGSIAFFIVMIIFFLAVWFSFYAIMATSRM